ALRSRRLTAPARDSTVSTRSAAISRLWFPARCEATQEPHDQREYDDGRRDRAVRARGLGRPSLRPLPRGVRGRRGLQALAGQDGDGGRGSPLLPADDEPPPAARQRRL